MGGGGSKTPANTTVVLTKRFAPYIETWHNGFIATVAGLRSDLITADPYAGYVSVVAEEGYIGDVWLISNFPSLYDMFGKFMSGFDVETLWNQIASDRWSKSETNALIQEEGDLLNDDMSNRIVANKLKYRELNAVQSSSFVIEESNIACSRMKDLASFSAETKYSLIPVIVNSCISAYNWQKEVIATYAYSIKDYYCEAVLATDVNYNVTSKDAMWPFLVTDFERSALNLFNPAGAYRKIIGPRSRSNLSKVLLVLSQTATGASVGFTCGGYVGAIVGAVIGFVVGVAMVLFE